MRGAGRRRVRRRQPIVKALASLKRFHEARDEAAALASRYPDSSWALDARRHMLVHPLDLPSREEQQRQMQQEEGAHP